MANEALVEILEKGADAWVGWRNANPEAPIDLECAVLVKVKLSSGTHLNLIGANLRGARLYDCEMRNVDFRSADLTGAQVINSSFTHVDLSGATCYRARFCGIGFDQSFLMVTNLARTDLDGASFTNCQLTGADLRGAQINSTTTFEETNVRGCKIDRVAIASLSADTFTPGEISTMRVNDPVTTLRKTFGGVFGTIHLASVAVFLVPYMWFLTYHGTEGASEGISLGTALWRYIYNGGQHLRDGLVLHWSFLAFLFTLAFSIARLALLWKTKQLEIQEASSGVPANFSLTGKWGRFLDAVRVAFWVNLLVVTLNTLHFLSTRMVSIERL